MEMNEHRGKENKWRTGSHRNATQDNVMRVRCPVQLNELSNLSAIYSKGQEIASSTPNSYPKEQVEVLFPPNATGLERAPFGYTWLYLIQFSVL